MDMRKAASGTASGRKPDSDQPLALASPNAPTWAMEKTIAHNSVSYSMQGGEKDFSARLLEWYSVNKRALPWREDPSPYHVWLSEIMLQQTRVEAVKKYYLRFLSCLPDIPSLANAPESLYLKLWEGLGYYSRVRNLHKGAVQVMEEYGGALPGNYKQLQKIAGIGPYTAAAIASIAFQESVPAVDGNLLRLFARLAAFSGNIKETPAKAAAFSFFQERMPPLNPGDFNQALMDLGAMVCMPNAAPACVLCPLSAFCRAHFAASESLYPKPFSKKTRQAETRTVLLIHDRERVLIRQRPGKGLLAGLYEFPNFLGHLSETEAVELAQGLLYPPHSAQKPLPFSLRPLPPAKHIFTHKEWHMIGYELILDTAFSGNGLPGSEDWQSHTAYTVGLDTQQTKPDFDAVSLAVSKSVEKIGYISRISENSILAENEGVLHRRTGISGSDALENGILESRIPQADVNAPDLILADAISLRAKYAFPSAFSAYMDFLLESPGFRS